MAEGDLDFPLLFPDPAWNAMLRISNAAALAAGMPSMPLARTIDDAGAWDVARGEPDPARMSAQEEHDAILRLVLERRRPRYPTPSAVSSSSLHPLPSADTSLTRLICLRMSASPYMAFCDASNSASEA